MTLFEYILTLLKYKIQIVSFVIFSIIAYLTISFTAIRLWTSDATIWSPNMAQVILSRSTGQEMATLVKLEREERIAASANGAIVRIIGKSKDRNRSVNITKQVLNILLLEEAAKQDELQGVVNNLLSSVFSSMKTGRIDKETIVTLEVLRSLRTSPTLVVIDSPTTATRPPRKVLYGLIVTIVVSIVFSILSVSIIEWWKIEKELYDKSKSERSKHE